VTVKVPPRGTHGVPFPKFPSWLARTFSRLQARAFRRSRGGHTGGGVDAILLHTVGARSGEARTALLGYIAETPDSMLIIASLAGAARNPAWLYNLAHDPRATIEFGDGRRVEVAAETLEDADLEAAWARIAREAPEYTKYESKTDRPIAVIRLQEAAGPTR
jgi:deazaflavin-dependent oxidoreductase (nitroreductase family)